MFMYLLIAFWQFIAVCFVLIILVFIFAILPISLEIVIHSCFKDGFVGGIEMLLYFCKFIMLEWLN